jgi:hypothetical protein
MARCFAQSNPSPVVTSSFRELLNSLQGAILVAKRQKDRTANTHDTVVRAQTGQNTVEIDPKADTSQTQLAHGNASLIPTTTTSSAFSTTANFNFEDLFGYRDNAEPGNLVQLWPVDYDGLQHEDPYPFMS